MGGRHTLAMCLPKVDRSLRYKKRSRARHTGRGIYSCPGLSPGSRPAHRPLCSLPCIFREATPGLLVKSPTLLNTGDPRLVEVDSVEQ